MLAGYHTSADGAGSRMCKEQRAGGFYLKARWDFTEPLQTYMLALFSFLLRIL